MFESVTPTYKYYILIVIYSYLGLRSISTSRAHLTVFFRLITCSLQLGPPSSLLHVILGPVIIVSGTDWSIDLKQAVATSSFSFPSVMKHVYVHVQCTGYGAVDLKLHRYPGSELSRGWHNGCHRRLKYDNSSSKSNSNN